MTEIKQLYNAMARIEELEEALRQVIKQYEGLSPFTNEVIKKAKEVLNEQV